MKAALLLRPGEIVIDEVPEPEPGPGEVRITVGGVGLCGSDLAVFKGRGRRHGTRGSRVTRPSAPIDAVGERVPATASARCRGRAERRLLRVWRVPPRPDLLMQRPPVVGMNRPGALAEQLVVPSDNAWSIPGHAARDLVCVEPLAVIEAAFRRMGDPPIGTALVIGVGSQGLLATLSLVARGTAVLVHDVNPARVALAISLGARALDPDDAAVSSISSSTRWGGRGGRCRPAPLSRSAGRCWSCPLTRRHSSSGPDDRPAPARHPRIADLRPPRGLRCHGRARPRERSRRAGSSPTNTPWTRRGGVRAERSAGGKTWIRVAGSVPG